MGRTEDCADHLPRVRLVMALACVACAINAKGVTSSSPGLPSIDGYPGAQRYLENEPQRGSAGNVSAELNPTEILVERTIRKAFRATEPTEPRCGSSLPTRFPRVARARATLG